MKTVQAAFVYFLLLSFSTMSAQYGNNGYGNNGYGNNGYGRGNSMNQMSQNREPQKPEEIPVEVTVAKIMERMTPSLELDALQEIAVANVITESIRSQGILMKDDSNQEQKLKEFQALSETTDRKIKEFLNADQIEKYKAMKDDRTSPKKKKRKK
ncbi:hypothetical protein [Flavobacterium frigidarium]|jgi:hypothetical protein|uniref:hypothetical protein n=1 Tax=Flavobacterium frigidarium TaxID=99286 RepID=UPI0004201C09|nr:hypothetical protein [Flavobacterium frigidarium]MDG1871624.1 hypothetical protein [Flavobacterium sp.]|tara:strand:- start:33371 stop:33835 length:465 start_codon:yes stop_codon:yes gene_type:complete